jgi:hypothetical protein
LIFKICIVHPEYLYPPDFSKSTRRGLGSRMKVYNVKFTMRLRKSFEVNKPLSTQEQTSLSRTPPTKIKLISTFFCFVCADMINWQQRHVKANQMPSLLRDQKNMKHKWQGMGSHHCQKMYYKTPYSFNPVFATATFSFKNCA